MRRKEPPKKGTDMNENLNPSTEATETIHDLWRALMDTELDSDWMPDTFGEADQIKVWHGKDHETYTVIGAALDEDQNLFPGFNWADYEVLGDGADDDYDQGYAATVAEAVADLTRKAH